jgi:hypothetical protein
MGRYGNLNATSFLPSAPLGLWGGQSPGSSDLAGEGGRVASSNRHVIPLNWPSHCSLPDAASEPSDLGFPWHVTRWRRRSLSRGN